MKTAKPQAQKPDLNGLVFSSALEGIMIFESVRDAADIIVDLLLVDVNPAGLSIVQRTRDQLVGKRLSQAFPGNFETGTFDRYRDALETGEQQIFEIHYQFDGLDHWFDVSANPVDADLLIITFVDISRIKRSALLLEQREAELRFILDAMPARIWYKDDKNTIIRLNKAAADAMGMPIEEAEGANTYDLFPAIAAQYHKDDLKALDGKKPLLGIIERFMPKDGKQGWLTTDKVPFIEPNSDDRRLLVVSTDITAQKKTEEELRVANESLTHFAYIAAHDLQAPLRQIGMFADLLFSEISDDETSSKTRSHLGQIRDLSARLRKLVGRLLDFSKIGTSEISMERVSLSAIIDAALLESGISQDDHANVSIELGEYDHVHGDTILLAQVFTNLFQNSLKYGSKEQFELRITAEIVKGLYTVRIWDNGNGIPPAFAERIFEVFSRLSDSSTTTGAGIGLAFCRKVIARHGGTIWLDQANTAGTCFVLTLVPAFEWTEKLGSEQ